MLRLFQLHPLERRAVVGPLLGVGIKLGLAITADPLLAILGGRGGLSIGLLTFGVFGFLHVIRLVCLLSEDVLPAKDVELRIGMILLLELFILPHHAVRGGLGHVISRRLVYLCGVDI